MNLNPLFPQVFLHLYIGLTDKLLLLLIIKNYNKNINTCDSKFVLKCSISVSFKTSDVYIVSHSINHEFISDASLTMYSAFKDFFQLGIHVVTGDYEDYSFLEYW